MSPIDSLFFVRSELFLAGAFFALLALDLFVSNKKWIGWLAFCSLAAALFLRPPFYPEEEKIFFDYFVLDPFTDFFKLAAFGAAALAILSALAFEKIPRKQEGEFYLLLLALALLLTFMGGAVNLLMIFLTIESVSLVSYLLVGFQKFDKRSSEAALKYVLVGAVSSAVMLFGMSLLFGVTGSIWLSQIGSHVQAASGGNQAMLLIGMLFLLAGIGFKISAVPFHMWAPDVYQGAPTPFTAFLTVAPKALGFAVMARVLFLAFPDFVTKWSQLLAALSILTMTAGNLIAISQSDVKRLLAYSSIAQAGYILAGLASASELGLQAVLIYVAAYLFTNLGAFFTVLAVERNTGSNELQAYNGLSQRSPMLALVLALFLLSLAGIPPLAGFIGKVYIFTAALKAHSTWLALAIALNSAAAAYYYFKVVKAMYLTPPESIADCGLRIADLSFGRSDQSEIRNPKSAIDSFPIQLALGVTLLGVFAIGLFPAPLIQLAARSLSSFPVF